MRYVWLWSTIFLFTLAGLLTSGLSTLWSIKEYLLESYDDHASLTVEPRHAIFYNVYLDATQSHLTLQVIEEQFAQIRNHTPRSIVHFTTIGYNGTDAILALCASKSLACRHLAHYESGFERLTMAHLQSHCLTHPQDVVTYLHPKGSFHPSPHQHRWRFLLTEAALSSLCLQAVQKDGCNLCALTFHWLWSHFVAGNMWTARCDYISQLIHPVQYAEYSKRLLLLDQELQAEGKIQFTLIPGMLIHGVGRFADEEWVSQHPNVRPCDCSNGWDVFYEGRQRPGMMDPADFVIQPAPVAEEPSNGYRRRASYLNGKKKLYNDTEGQVREYFFLAGHILNWWVLYNQTPPADSWVWDWYPHGRFWRSLVDHYGAHDAVLVALSTNWTELCRHARNRSVLPCEPEWVGWKNRDQAMTYR